jgi:TPP-dependent 2-oxoacid decarboxylase
MNPSEENDPEKSNELHENELEINTLQRQLGRGDRVISEKGTTFHGIINSTR